MNKLMVFLFFLFFSSFHSQAEVINADLYSEGDGRAVFDTSTGLEWLDLDFTVNQSIDQVKERIATGGDLYGWRLPTYEEIFQLAVNIYPKMNNIGSEQVIFQSNDYNEGSDVYRYFGYTYYGYTIGMYQDKDGNVDMWGIESSGSLYFNHNRSSTTSFNRMSDGVFLVSDNQISLTSQEIVKDVSVRGSAVFFMLFGFLFFLRRDKASHTFQPFC